MDRLATLSRDLASILDELHDEATRRNASQLEAPLAWLHEANGWLNYELAHLDRRNVQTPAVRFTYVPMQH